MRTQEHIDAVKRQISKLNKQIKWLKAHAEKLDKCEAEPTVYPHSIDFDNQPHKRIIQLIRHLGGKWTKEAHSDGKVDYTTEIDGMPVRCWRGEPPPNCKIVPFEVHVPAHTKTEYKLVCPKGANGNQALGTA